MYYELERDMGHQVEIVVTNGLTFQPRVFRTLIINSQTSGSSILQPATGELQMCSPKFMTLLMAFLSGGSDFVAVVNGVVDVDSSPFSFNYTLIQDDIHEEDEMFNLVLSIGTGVAASIAPESGTATITITDEDCKLMIKHTSRSIL